MAKVNVCLRRVFSIFNVFFAIVGGLIIIFALVCQLITSLHGDFAVSHLGGIILLYVLGIITMVIAILGAYGAHRERKLPMIIFLICMVMGTMMLFRSGVNSLLIHPQLESLIKNEFETFIPLDRAPENKREMVSTMQEQLHCCGLFSHSDWENKYPDSCLCDPEVVEEPGECQAVNYLTVMMSQKYIYSKTCLPIIIEGIKPIIIISICMNFVLLVLALLGMILSSIIIHQMQKIPHQPTVMTVPAMFSPSPPKYQELQTPPHY
ncbi:tetraspanin-8-like [Echeneis naucrates]|uniref:Tetraspanin n=1 Tax=Echeneis naucrates TaxID=173247 RepID=A0A665TCX2_ECHNA|nr:tetraspanin-8-like [Echeneis naucrates]